MAWNALLDSPMFWNLPSLPLILLGLASCTLHAAPLQIGIGEDKPPYVQLESRSGVEYEIITQTLKDAGLDFEIKHVPNKRARSLFTHGQLDAAITTEGSIVSEPYIAYRNMAITLCEQHIGLGKVTDLLAYKIGAFNNAESFLGTDFSSVASRAVSYREISPQKLLNAMLQSKRIDVAVAEINIFEYVHRSSTPTDAKALCPFPLFPPTLYRLEFRDAALRDRFNQALAQLRTNGFYEALAKKYQLPLEGKRPYFKP